MKLQTPDTLCHNGFVFAANAEEALAAYVAAQALASPPSCHAPHSEYVRGYASTWEIRNDRLYLRHVHQTGRTVGEKPRSFALMENDGLLADWFTGAIYVDDAKVDCHEEDLCLSDERPVVAFNFACGLLGLVRLLRGAEASNYPQRAVRNASRKTHLQGCVDSLPVCIDPDD